MKYLLFTIFSTFECVGVFMFGLALFKITITANRVKNTITSSLILSSFSLALTLLNLTSISVFLQYILMMVLINRFLTVKPKLSIIIGFCAYTIYGATQAGILVLLKANSLITDLEIAPFSYKGYIIQFAGFLIFMAITFFIRRSKDGFDFVLDSKRASKIKTYTNKLILTFVCMLLLILSGAFFEYKSFTLYLNCLFVSLLIASIALIYISLRRDKEESEI